MTFKRDLDLESLGYAYHPTERNIWVKFNENGSAGSGDMEQT